MGNGIEGGMGVGKKHARVGPLSSTHPARPSQHYFRQEPSQTSDSHAASSA